MVITTGNLASPIVVETVKERGATLSYCFDEKKWRLLYVKLSNFSCNLHQHLHQPFCTVLINIHNENVCVMCACSCSDLCDLKLISDLSKIGRLDGGSGLVIELS